jgi:hypothetical protein
LSAAHGEIVEIGKVDMQNQPVAALEQATQLDPFGLL